MGVDSKKGLTVYLVSLKEALLELARKDEMSSHELNRYMPKNLIVLLTNRGFLERIGEKMFCDPVPEFGPNKCHVYGSTIYSLTLDGAELANKLSYDPITVKISSTCVEYHSNQQTNLTEDVNVKSLEFGFSKVLVDETLENVLRLSKK